MVVQAGAGILTYNSVQIHQVAKLDMFFNKLKHLSVNNNLALLLTKHAICIQFTVL